MQASGHARGSRAGHESSREEPGQDAQDAFWAVQPFHIVELARQHDARAAFTYDEEWKSDVRARLNTIWNFDKHRRLASWPGGRTSSSGAAMGPPGAECFVA